MEYVKLEDLKVVFEQAMETHYKCLDKHKNVHGLDIVEEMIKILSETVYSLPKYKMEMVEVE